MEIRPLFEQICCLGGSFFDVSLQIIIKLLILNPSGLEHKKILLRKASFVQEPALGKQCFEVEEFMKILMKVKNRRHGMIRQGRRPAISL